MKHKLRSRVLTGLLSFMLILGLMPTTVFASEPAVPPTTIQVNGTDILKSENHIVSCGSGTATYDPDTNTLTLNHAEINYQQNANSNSKGAILFDGDLNINLVGENTITSVTCGIRGTKAGTLTITGDSLTFDCLYYGIGMPFVDANITIDGADLDFTVKGEDDYNYIGTGIQAGGVLSIKNGAYIDATDVSHHPIIGNAGIEIVDSTLYAQQYTEGYVAILSDNNISISNSTVEARADSTNSYAVWAGNDLSSPPTSGNIIISNGSDVTLYSKTANAVFALYGDISISGSTVKAESGASPALSASYDIDITDLSHVTAISAGSIGIWSQGGAIEIQNSIAQVTANSEWDAIRGENGGVTISGSWVETFGFEVSPDFTSSNSAVFLNNEGSASGSLTLPGDVTVDKDMRLSIPEDSSVTVPDGVTFTNHGSIEVLGGIVKKDGGIIVCDSHAGGTATCTSKAVCDICGNEYGDFASHNLTKTEAQAATCAKEGNKEYWYCETCKKYFCDSEGKNEITPESTVIPAAGHSYENGKCTVCGALDPDFKAVIIAGANGTWQKGVKDGLSFTSNAAYEHFQKVLVDKKELDASNYTVKEGSTIVTLKASYLETLSVGKHTLSIVSETGTAETNFTIRAASTVTATNVTTNNAGAPRTGDNSNIALWIATILVAGAALSGNALYNRKRKDSK